MTDNVPEGMVEITPEVLARWDEKEFGCFRRLDVDGVAAFLANPHVTPAMLSRKMLCMKEGDDRVSYLYMVACQIPKSADEAERKLRIMHMLLDAGATNVNHGYYFFGVSGLTAFSAACFAPLWPFISQDDHRVLVKRMYDAGGKPNYRLQPLGKTARMHAEKTAPYLLDLLPATEENDGQMRFWPADEMPHMFSPALNRQLGMSTLERARMNEKGG